MSKSIEPKNKLKRREKSELKGRLHSFLMFLPNMVMLLGRLLKDIRVPTVSPIDFIPDVFPFIGQVDDLYMVALVLLRLVNRTDESVVREHWSGGGDIVALADSIAGIAPKFLPKRIARVITSRVELAPAGKVLRGITKRDEAVVREIDSEEFELEARTPFTSPRIPERKPN